jgi:hypothetical protein
VYLKPVEELHDRIGEGANSEPQLGGLGGTETGQGLGEVLHALLEGAHPACHGHHLTPPVPIPAVVVAELVEKMKQMLGRSVEGG